MTIRNLIGKVDKITWVQIPSDGTSQKKRGIVMIVKFLQKSILLDPEIKEIIRDNITFEKSTISSIIFPDCGMEPMAKQFSEITGARAISSPGRMLLQKDGKAIITMSL